MRRAIVEAVAGNAPEGVNVSRLRSMVAGKASTIAEAADWLTGVKVLAVHRDHLSKVYELGPGASGYLDSLVTER
jgi:hypothetical protein